MTNYEAIFKKTVGFHTEAFAAENDDQARLFLKAFQEKARSAGEGFYYPLVLKKIIPTY